MPPKRTSKRKADEASLPSSQPEKAAKLEEDTQSRFDHSRAAEKFGIVQREFYPPELSNERCAQYAKGEIRRPHELLEETIEDTEETRNKIEVGNAVVHWFKRDLRLNDNTALAMASAKAQTAGVPLICMYIISPQDFQAHCTSAPRVDFELRTLEVMKEDLAALDIPIYVETVDQRKEIPDHIKKLCLKWGARHLYCNIEYEVDELRRERKLIEVCLEENINVTAVHDDVVVRPGSLSSGSGSQYSVYSPFYRAWISFVHQNSALLDLKQPPAQNPETARSSFKDLFERAIPSSPSNKMLNEEQKTRYTSFWPAGEHEASERLNKFLDEKIGRYKDTRNFPAENSTAMISVHLATGTLSSRMAVRSARDANSTKKLDGGNNGISGWISEIVWRDFYKHVLVHWPYVCMNKSFKYEYSDIEWEYNQEHFDLWCQGRTGFPLVDAAMRQLNHMGYMHNRCRMTVASFLAKDLLLDWRMGEKYFMENLIDGDFASNNGGWGFSASTGVDPQPYFRIFNPLLQSEKFDEKGEYIRKWIPELSEIKGNAIHDPYNRGAAKIAEENGYPRPCVDHKTARNEALARYKAGLKRDTA